jgi:hypothetical protein
MVLANAQERPDEEDNYAVYFSAYNIVALEMIFKSLGVAIRVPLLPSNMS